LPITKGKTIPAIAEAKPLSFSHSGKQRVYQFLLIHPGADHAAYKIMGDDPNIGEREFDEVLRAMRVNDESDTLGTEGVKPKINPDIYFAKKTVRPIKKSKGVTMAKEATITATPRKRGRPPGSRSKKITNTEVKLKGKRGRPAKTSVSPKSPTTKQSGKGVRYTAEKQQEIVSFIISKGRGGLSQAKEKFGISYPTLARWVKQAGGGKGASKVEKASKKLGRPKKSDTVSSGHILISKRVLKEFQKGIASLEAAFGAFSNALRILK